MAHDPLSDAKVAFNSKRVEKILYYFMIDTLDKINKNIAELAIGRHNPNAHWEGVGDLEDSIRATINNNAGGNKALVTFFYQNYGRFVEIAVQREMPYVELPEMPGMVPVARPDGKPRKAKPFLHSEIRHRINQTLTRLGKMYAYAGAASFFQAVDDVRDTGVHNRNVESLEELGKRLGIV